MDTYDVVIVGAGPAGSLAARVLSKDGSKVLLAEKALSFSANDFSSGGAPLEILSDFELPRSVVGSFCHQIRISTTQDTQLWQAEAPIALVLDFKKLRGFLAEDATRLGAALKMGAVYQSHQSQNGKVQVSFKNVKAGLIETVEANILIDATGSERSVLMAGPERSGAKKKEQIVGRGIEYLIQVPAPVYQRYVACLSFFIGSKWMPQGYAWIFPMEAHRLKVGVGRNFPDEQHVPHEQSMQYYLQQLIQDCLKTEDIEILDRHGKTLSYTCHQRDDYFDQNVIAIGDAVSTVNPFTFEGIRHALKSAEIAAKHTQYFLQGKIQNFNAYQKEMRAYCGMKWTISELLTQKIYQEPDDEKMTMMLKALKGFNTKTLKDLVFYYQFRAVMKFYTAYQLAILKHAFSKFSKAMGSKR